MERIVKIRRTVGIDGERFWLRNVVDAGESLSGEVNNDLVFDHEFQIGDVIAFSESEIIKS